MSLIGVAEPQGENYSRKDPGVSERFAVNNTGKVFQPLEPNAMAFSELGGRSRQLGQRDTPHEPTAQLKRFCYPMQGARDDIINRLRFNVCAA